MPHGLALSDRLHTCVEVMTTLALPFPSSFEADADRAVFATVLPQEMLAERSTAPYSPQRIPVEHERMITLIELRWSGRFERPDLTVAAGGDWPELVLELPRSRVSARLLMPEAGMEGSTSRWAGDLAMNVNMTLRWVADVVRRAGEPDVGVGVIYEPNPDAERHRSQLPPDVQALIAPVAGIIGVDLSRCGAAQRQAVGDAAAAAAFSDQQIDWLPGGGFTTRLGAAMVRARP